MEIAIVPTDTKNFTHLTTDEIKTYVSKVPKTEKPKEPEKTKEPKESKEPEKPKE